MQSTWQAFTCDVIGTASIMPHRIATIWNPALTLPQGPSKLALRLVSNDVAFNNLFAIGYGQIKVLPSYKSSQPQRDHSDIDLNTSCCQVSAVIGDVSAVRESHTSFRDPF
jgi:hypothetical protein